MVDIDQKQSIRRFQFVRETDVSGISGIGVVCEGVEFTDGSVVVRWLSHTSSFGTFSNIKNFLTVHGHEGAGIVQWIDIDPVAAPESEKRITKKTAKKS